MAGSLEELIAYRATLDEQETRLRQQEDDQTTVQAELDESFERLRQAGAELSRQRQRVAKRLVAEVQRELADLGMAEARLDAVLEPVRSARSRDRRDPRLGPGPAGVDAGGQPRRAEPAAAQGGFGRRAVADDAGPEDGAGRHDQVSTLVFDEIDANVGGRLGDVLGEKLAALGRIHQVICVTHLPQVASYARHQWGIRKLRRGKRTTTIIELLGGPERLQELASMLRGEAGGETTRQEAAAMLEAARRHW